MVTLLERVNHKNIIFFLPDIEITPKPITDDITLKCVEHKEKSFRAMQASKNKTLLLNVRCNKQFRFERIILGFPIHGIYFQVHLYQADFRNHKKLQNISRGQGCKRTC